MTTLPNNNDIRKTPEDIITREYALKHGLKRYFTGKACINGHVSPRKTHSHACVECARQLVNRSRHPSLNGEAPSIRSGWGRRGVSDLPLTYDLFGDIFGNVSLELINRERAKNHNKRAKRRSVEGFHNGFDVVELLIMQEYRCGNWKCKTDLREAGSHIDHIVPIAKGGTNWPDNLHILCPKCNMIKGSKLPEEFF